ncbi:hypothetical protein Y032_0081g1480 [Ancylostoma ceylanicum]|uniref:Uncharacterized protein n=1 Tax=Ancylostoma ceylanicum TaxID=53326 RepID=A0A016TRG9_9BILA|nr:hypothetical protein Y032_0081g1480 [Ancylostoma ceylanicum]
MTTQKLSNDIPEGHLLRPYPVHCTSKSFVFSNVYLFPYYSNPLICKSKPIKCQYWRQRRRRGSQLFYPVQRSTYLHWCVCLQVC